MKLHFFFNKLKWDILTTMIHPAQGVQMTNHPRVFTRSRWLQQVTTTKTETNYKWTPIQRIGFCHQS